MLNETEQIQFPRKQGNEKLAQGGKEMQTCNQSIRTKKIQRDSRNTLKVKSPWKHQTFELQHIHTYKRWGGG